MSGSPAAAVPIVGLVSGYHARPSPAGISWTALTAADMFALAGGKARPGTALGNAVLMTEGRVTLVDGILAAAVLAGLIRRLGDRSLVGRSAGSPGDRVYALREAREIFTARH
jgi:hypothetical protein